MLARWGGGATEEDGGAEGREKRTSTVNPLYVTSGKAGDEDDDGSGGAVSGMLEAIKRKRSSIVDKLSGISDDKARRMSREEQEKQSAAAAQ